jgi:hypothetical protein
MSALFNIGISAGFFGMFKTIRIIILLLILLFVSVNTWLRAARSTDWNESLYVSVYPINADGSDLVDHYISTLVQDDFFVIEEFLEREASRFGQSLKRPVRVHLGTPISEQPPALGNTPSALDVMIWSMKIRWWASSITDDQDMLEPDVRIFVRYHAPRNEIALENSVGLQKGMVGVVNAYAGRPHSGSNNVVIAHEFLHTLGATDKYDPADGLPSYPLGYAEPDRNPRYPQELAEIMGGRIALTEWEAVIPKSLKYVLIGETTATEIGLRK